MRAILALTTMRPPPLILGVDIGGTKVAAGIVDAAGVVAHRVRGAMPATSGADNALLAVLAVIGDARSRAERAGETVTCVGIGVPGPLDTRSGVVLNPPNLPGWRDYPLAARISASTGLDVRLENDANAAALGEARWGAGRGYESLLFATFGTGIGTGILLRGELVRGGAGSTPEGGHVTIDRRGPPCGCGKRGCIEALASGTALVRQAREAASSPTLLHLAGGDPARMTAEVVVEAAKAGEALAVGILEEATEAVGVWLGSLYDLFEPQAVILGGGLGPIYVERAEHLRRTLATWAIRPGAAAVPLLPAALGVDAGLIGAAALWL